MRHDNAKPGELAVLEERSAGKGAASLRPEPSGTTPPPSPRPKADPTPGRAPAAGTNSNAAAETRCEAEPISGPSPSRPREAIETSDTENATPPATNPRKGRGRAKSQASTVTETPGCEKRPHGQDAGHIRRENQKETARVQTSPQGEGRGHVKNDTQCQIAPPDETPRAEEPPRPKADARAGGEAEVHNASDLHTLHDLRFADPLIAEIVETWRSRQDMVRAQQKLTLQIKAICRRFCAGDKKEAAKLYAAIEKSRPHPLAEAAEMACIGLFQARLPLEHQRKAYEKHLDRLGKRLPIAHLADEIKGVNHKTLAMLVGELGDLTTYEKGISGVWKRAGLAVIDGERQRKKADKEAALRHGYSPSRRSVFWNLADALLKSQGKEETAGPYRLIYDARKAYERPRVDCDGHAHNRALRFMCKRLLKDIWIAWRAVNAGTVIEAEEEDAA